MSTFYQIVKRQDCDGTWLGFFTDDSEIYSSYDEAYKKAEELAIAKTQNHQHLHVQHRTEKGEQIIEIFNEWLHDIELEYYIKELTLA